MVAAGFQDDPPGLSQGFGASHKRHRQKIDVVLETEANV